MRLAANRSTVIWFGAIMIGIVALALIKSMVNVRTVHGVTEIADPPEAMVPHDQTSR